MVGLLHRDRRLRGHADRVAVRRRLTQAPGDPHIAPDGRAGPGLYAFVTVLFVALLALAGTASRLVGVGELGVAVAVLALSTPFTLRARRSASLNYRRAFVYHAGLVVVAVAGAIRAINGTHQYGQLTLAIGVLLLLGIALSNSWQLVLSHEGDQ